MASSATSPRFAVDYVHADNPAGLLADPGVLAVFGFGDTVPLRLQDPRYLRVPLQPYGGPAPFEVWRTDEPVRHGRDGEIAWASNGKLAFGVIEVEEGEGGIEAAAAHAYERLTGFVREKRHAVPAAHLELPGRHHARRRRCRALSAVLHRARARPRHVRSDAVAGSHRHRPLRRCARVAGVLAGGRRAGDRRWRTRGRSAHIVIRVPMARSHRASPARCCRRPRARAAAALRHRERGRTCIDACRCDTGPGRRDLRQFRQPAGCRATVAAGVARGVRQRHATEGVRARHGDLETVAAAMQSRYGLQVPHIVLHAAICRRELCVEIDGVHSA